MTSTKYLGEAIAGLIPRKNQAVYVCTPVDMGHALPDRIVEVCNALADTGPVAVRVVRGDFPGVGTEATCEKPYVYASAACGYRDRALVWVDGDAPDVSSMASTVAPIIAKGFPGDVESRASVANLGHSLVETLKRRSADRFTPYGWESLDTVLTKVLDFLRQSFEAIGNEDKEWTMAWWHAAALFMEGLGVRIESGETLSSTAFDWVYAIAGLPLPSGNQMEYKRLKPEQYAKIVQERFSSKDLAEETLAWMKASSTRGALHLLPWDSFPDVLGMAGHVGAGLVILGGLSLQRLEAWAGTGEEAFMALLAMANENGEIEIELAGRPIPSIGPTKGVYLLPSCEAEWSNSSRTTCEIRFNSLVVIVPWRRDISAPTRCTEPPRLTFRPRTGWSLDISKATCTTRGVELKGILSYSCRSNAKWPDKPISLICDTAGSLSGFLNKDAECKIVLPSPWGPTIVIAHGDSRAKVFVGAGGKFKFASGEFTPTETDPYEISLRKETDALMVCYNGQRVPNADPVPESVFTVGRVTSSAMVTEGKFGGLTEIPKIRLTNGMEVRDPTGEVLVGVSIDEEIPHPWLPLAATALDTTPNDGVPTRDMTDRLRGHLESLWIEDLRTLPKIDPSAMVYCVLPTSTAETLQGAPVQGGPYTKWLTRPEDGLPLSIENAGKGPDAKLTGTPEFTSLFQILGELILELEKHGNGGRNVWPCRWQLKDLPQATVDRYLDAYRALVERGKNIGVEALFWASYPFSAIIYNPYEARVTAILMSPLHPIRLAWLYGAERAIIESGCVDRAELRPLAQLLEGWNLPAVGPAPGYEPVTLAATPIDAGPEQLFLGWSALVSFEMNTGSQLQLPSHAGGWRMPGGSSSGLNQGGVGAAIRDFLRVYPHLPTITLELFASMPTPRSVELDIAVMSELAKVTADEADAVPLPHSLRIIDSDNRQGTPPERDDAFEAFTAVSGGQLPAFEWRSYPASEATRQCADLRLVEDAQARISLARGKGQPVGVTGRWPVRRFVLRQLVGQDTLLHSCVDLARCQWRSFASALDCLERTPFVTMDALRVKPVGFLLGTASKARWVVTGNILVDPSAVARMVTEPDTTPSMLWEWRPPFLPRRKSGTEIDFGRRPYMTVARIPAPFRERLSILHGVDDHRAKQMLLYLGQRGIGLASLLAMGDNHAEGALGFFFGLKTMDILRRNGENQSRKILVVPLDAVNTLLAAIAGEDDGTLRRADVLTLVAESDAANTDRFTLTLLPVEIRCTGLLARSHESGFPAATAQEVSKKIEQLRETAKCFGNVIKSLEQGDPIVPHMQRAAMAGVVETALLLRPSDPHLVDDPVFDSRLVDAVMNGTATYRAKPGVLLWFQKTPEGTLSFKTISPSDGKESCVFINPDGYNRDLWGNESGTLGEYIVPVFLETQPTAHEASSATERPRDTTQEEQIPVDKPPVTTPAPKVIEPVAAVTQSAVVPVLISPEPHGRPRVRIGSSRDYSEGVSWDPMSPAGRLPNSHVVILGSAGSGKTQALLSFLLELHRAGIPSLVLDFKDDYVQPDILSAIGGNMHDALDSLPINPLALPVDARTGMVSVMTHVYAMSGIFKAVYRLGDIQEAHLKEAIFRTYEQNGIPRNTRDPELARSVPQFDGVRQFLDAIGDAELNNRLAPIFDLSLFKEGTQTVEGLLSATNVIRFTQLPSEEIKKAAGGILLRSVYNALLKQGHQQGLKLALVIDEAHRVANLEPVKLLVKEARAYGVGVFLSSQEARDFEDFVFSNAASMLTLKLSETADADRVAKLLVGNTGYRELSDNLKGLGQFEGYFRNDHYRPYASVTVRPFYERLKA